MMLNWFKRKKILSAEVAALKLNLNAIDGLDTPRYPTKLNTEDNNSLNTLIYLTRAATIILALKVCELKKSDGKRAEEVLNEFHKNLYSPTPDGTNWNLVSDMKSLMEQVLTLRTMPADESETNGHFLQRVELWAESWLQHLPNAERVVQSVGKLAISVLGARVIDEANAIDKLVTDVLYHAQ
jgi:hypothetical protein